MRERSKNRRLRRQSLFIYAQLAEAFVEWGGLVPRSTGEFNLKHGGVWHSIAPDSFGIAEPRLETIAMGEELRERITCEMGALNDVTIAAEHKEQLDNLDRLAFVHTCDGVIGPLPVGWTRHLFALDRKGEPVFPRREEALSRPNRPGADCSRHLPTRLRQSAALPHGVCNFLHR